MDLIQPSNFTGYFCIARWHAWAPGIKNMEDWRAWLKGELQPSPDEQLDIRYLPALLRRRLDRFGRMALHTAWLCAEGLDSLPYVFASRHGALNRTVDLLTALANEDTLSPTQFTLSVHNSVAGLFAIARGDRSAATAMAAGPDSLGLSLLEGATMIAEGNKRVLVTYIEDVVPEIYRTQIPETVRSPFVISLLLAPAGKSAWRCRLVRHTGLIAQQQSPEVALIRFLTEDTIQVVLGTDQTWQLERDCVG